MAQTQIYSDLPPVKVPSNRGFNVPVTEQPAPEALETEREEFKADYTEDRSVPALAKRRRQALAETKRSFVNMDLP